MKARTSSPSLRWFCCLLFAYIFCAVSSLPLLAITPGATPATGPQGPKIWLDNNQALTVNQVGQSGLVSPLVAGQAQPLAMTSADVDSDGIADLLVGYSTPNGGSIVVYRGNLDAFAPQSDASFQAIGRGEFPSPFLPDALVFAVPVRPDFLATGDFTGHGHADLVVASRGGSTLYVFSNDGKGNFTPANTINLPGGVSALASGPFGSVASALIVGVSNSRQSFLAVYAGSAQGLSPLAAFPLTGAATNINFGSFGDLGAGIAFLSGGQVQLLHGSPLKVDTVSLPGTAVGLALGSFVADRYPGLQIAILGSDGSVQIAVHNQFDPRPYNSAEQQAVRLAAIHRQPNPILQPVATSGWRIVESFAAVGSVTPGQAPVFFRTRISNNGADDIMWIGAANGQMAVLSHPDPAPGATTFSPGQISVKPYNGSPIAGMPMRLNVDGRPGIIALHQGQIAPAASMPLPDPVFNVNTTADGVHPGACAAATAGQCTLREAILEANGDTIMVPNGTYSLTIGRGATQDYSGNTGALYVNHSATIVGASQAGVIIQWGTPSCVPASPCTVDLVMAVNADSTTPFTNATASLSGLTIQNGVNHGSITTAAADGFAGGIEFDTGLSGTNTLTLTNVTVTNNSTIDGDGGGIAIFNTNDGTGAVTINSSTISNNTPKESTTGGSGLGGGIYVGQPGSVTLNSTSVTNNNATQTNNPRGQGGGLYLTGQTGITLVTTSAIHGGSISGNTAAGEGGGIYSIQGMTIDGGTLISNNSSGVAGGGIWYNAPSPYTASLSKVAITGNSVTGSSPDGIGGGIRVDSGAPTLTIAFSRIAGNTATTKGSNLSQASGTVTATTSASPGTGPNWWGTNAAASTIDAAGGTLTFDPFIVLTHTSAPQKIRINQSSTLTGDMSKDNHGNGAALTGNLDEIVGLPITFNNPVLGTIPQAQPESLGNPVPTATATFNAGNTPGTFPSTPFGTANARVDQAVVAVNSNLIATATESGSTATITTVGAHGYAPGEFVIISGAGVAGYDTPANQVSTILTTPTATTFTYTTTASGLASSTGGLVNAGIDILAPPSIAKSFSPTTVATNTPSTVTFSITNGNSVPINGSFSDGLPSNLVVATTPTIVNNCGGSVTATAGSGTITFSNPALPAGTCTVQVNVQSAIDNIYSNSVTIDSIDAGNGNLSTATLTVINPPHIAKAFGAATIPLNGITSLTLTLSSTNVNLSLSNISFTDSLPLGLVVATPSGLSSTCSGTATAAAGSGSVSLSGASLAPGTSCTVSLNVQGTTAGVKSNSVQASDAVAGPGNTATATVTVIAPPSIVKVFNPTSIALNNTSSLQFTITNPAPNTISLTGVSFTDTLPAGLTVASSTATVCGGTLTTTAPTGIALTGATIAAAGQCQFSVTITGAAAGAFTNTTGAVTSTEGGTGNTASALLTVVAPPSIAKAFNPTTIALNGTTVLTFTITNPAANTVAENGVAFTDTLPTGLTVASGTSTVCGGTLTTTAPTGISLTGATIAVGGQCQFPVTVTGAVSGQYTNTTGNVTSTNGGAGNTASANLTVVSPPTIAKSFNPATIAQGATTSLQFTITNPAVNTIALTGVGFTDTLPTGLTVASSTSTVCGGTLTTTSPTGISLSGATVAASGQCQFTVTVTGAVGGQYTNTTGAVTSTEGGTGNTASASVTVVAPPSIIKAFNPTSIALNGTSSLTFTITNPVANAVSLTGVAFTDTLPTGLTVASSTATVCGGTLTTTAPTGISLTGATVAAAGQCQFSVTVTGAAAGAFTNTTGNVSSTNGGTGNTASALLTVVAPPSIAKAFNPTTIALNGTTVLTFTITNPAANTTTENGVAFTDTLPTGLVVSTPNGLTNSCGGTPTATAGSTSISLTGGTIALNSSCTVSVNITGTASGLYTNTSGAVSSTNGGTGNTATANLTVASPPTINKGFAPASVSVGATSVLTFTIQNPNSGVALTGIAFADNLPSGVVVASAPGASNSCGGTFTAVGGASSLNLAGGTLPVNGTCTASVNVQATTAGVKNNTTGAITSNEGGTGTTSNTATLTVTPATTTTAVISSLNPSIFGQAVTFTATVTDTSAGSTAQPTGSVQFLVDGAPFGVPVALTGASSTSSTATSQATATLSVTGSPHTVVAVYTNADGNFTSGSGSLSPGQTVTPAITNTAVISSANPSAFGQSVTFTATVTDISPGSVAQPTGTVQFVVDGAPFGTPVTLTGASSNSSTATSQATATLTISGSPHSVTANYTNADANFVNSSGSLSGGQIVNQAGTTTTVNSSAGTITLGDTVTFTATVTVNSPATGTPTGIVTFFDGTTPIGNGKLNALSPDQTTFSTAVLGTGSHSITAIYNGDANFSASPLSAPTTETVNLRGSTTGVALNPTTVGVGGASTITTTVTDGGASTPPGTPDAFTPTGAPATGRTGFTATLFADGAVVVIGGTDANNVVLNTAEVFSGGSFTATPGNLNTARTGAVAVLLPNGKVLIAGGSSNGSANGALNSAELLDLNTGTFAPTSQNMTAARFGATATLLSNGKVLLAGGSNSGGALNSAELYDPAADTFTATGNLNAARTGASATLLTTGKVLVAGGSSDGTAGGALSSAELFDPAGTFTPVGGTNLSAGRWQPAAALLLSGKVLVAGGQNSGGPLTTADVYDPIADSFAPSAHEMNQARANGSAVTLPNGMVLLPGGTTSVAVDLYDADGDKFDTTGNLQNSDTGLVATQLNNGQVLVVGLTNTATPASDAELYSPSFNPLGTVGFGSSDGTDVFGAPCVLTPSASSSTASTCTSTVTAGEVGTSPHTITGTYPADAVHSGSSNTASLTVIPTAPPTIAKAFSVTNVAQNTTVNVSFTIVNPNPAANLTGISFTDALPAGLVVANPNNLNSNCGGTFTAAPGSSSLSLTGGTVGQAGPPPPLSRRKSVGQTSLSSPVASGQCVITVDLLVTGTGTISNTTGAISANESGPGNPSNTASINVVLAPTVNKAFGAASIPVNGTTSLTFNIANPNTAIALRGIALSDTLPSGLVVANPNGLAGSCVALSVITANAGSNSVNLTLLNLPAAASCSFSVNVTGTSGGTQTNTTAPITGTFDDGTGVFRIVTGGTASASVVVVAPPSIAKVFNPAVIAPNGVSTLTFTITNPAVNTAAESGVAVNDNLPAGVIVATPNGVTGTCNGGTVTAVAGSGSISLTGGTVPAAGTCVFSVNVTAAALGTYTNTSGAVTSTNGGTGNTATAVLNVKNASLSITKTHQGTFHRGQNGAQYFLTVSDDPTAGPTTGTVTVVDTLPVIGNPHNLVPVSLAGAGWTCDLPSLTCTRSDTLAPGASYPVITFTVNIPQNITNHFTNTATVSGGGDPNSHTAADPVNLGPPIDIESTDSGSATVVGGNAAVFNFSVDATAINPPPTVVSFTCSGLPTGSACIFSPLAEGQGLTQLTVTITTLGPGLSMAAPPASPKGKNTVPLYATLLFPVFGLLGVGVRRSRGKKLGLRLGVVFSGLVILLALSGCGGTPMGLPTVTNTGTFTVTVTGTAQTAQGMAQGSATVTLTVQK